MIQFLIDECRSPALLQAAWAHGYNAYHVTQRGWSTLPDPELVWHVLHEGLTLVTNNWRDFRVLLGRTELHPGIVVILPNVRRGAQVELFTAALRFMCAKGLQADLINTVLEVDEDGRVQRYPFPDG